MARIKLFGWTGAALALAAALLAPAGAAHKPASLLFAAFKKLCLDTDADPRAVVSALAGAVLLSSHPDQPGSDVPGSTATMAQWHILIAGHKTEVFVGTEHIPHHGSLGTRDSESCSILSDDGDPATREAARAWAAVPRDKSLAGDGYLFLADGNTHHSFSETTREDDDIIQTGGHARMLTVNVAPHFASLLYIRFHGLADGDKRP